MPVLVCRLGSVLCAVPVEHVGEAFRPLPVDRIADPPASVLGVCVVRGRPIPVLDGRALLGMTAVEPPGRFVTLRLGARWAALAVDSVVGVRGLDPSAPDSVAPLLGRAAAEVVEALGMLDDQLLFVLREAHIVGAATQVAPEQQA